MREGPEPKEKRWRLREWGIKVEAPSRDPFHAGFKPIYKNNKNSI
jgi:hypothetical protein